MSKKKGWTFVKSITLLIASLFLFLAIHSQMQDNPQTAEGLFMVSCVFFVLFGLTNVDSFF